MSSFHPSRNKNYQYTSKVDDFKCLICSGVARDPLQHEECGRLFCKDCLDKYGKDKPCPNCRKGKSQYYVDKRSKRIIEALCVKCNNAERNCEWEGSVDAIEKHLTTCQFTPLPCPRKCRDTSNNVVIVSRQDVDSHLANDCPNRDYKCQECGEAGEYTKIMTVHDEVCPKKIVPCPNARCTKHMQRELVSKHAQSECEHTVVACKYQALGCDMTKKRRELTPHEQNDKLHLHMALDTIVQLKSENDKLKDSVVEIDKGMKQVQLYLKTRPTKYKLTDYQKLKESSKSFTFPPFYTHLYGYHVALKVYPNGLPTTAGSHVSVVVCFVRGNHDHQLNWPLCGFVTMILYNQLENDNHAYRMAYINSKQNARVGSEKGFFKFIPHSALGYNSVKKTQYLKDDTLYFTMTFTIPS